MTEQTLDRQAIDDEPQIGRSPLLVIFLTVFIDLLGFGIVILLIPFYAQSFGATKFEVGLLFASYSIMQFLFAPIWGRISDAVGRRPIILLCLLGTSISFTFFGMAESLLVLFAARIAAGLFGGVISTAYAFIADVTTREQRARGMGLLGAAFGLGFILGPSIGGVMAEAWGYPAPAYFAAGLALANFILAWFVLPESNPPDNRERPGRRKQVGGILSFIQLRQALEKPSVRILLLLYFIIAFALSNMEATYALMTEEIFDWGARENGYVFGYIGIIMVLVQGVLIHPLVRKFGEHALILLGIILLVPSLGLLPFSPNLAILLLLSGLMAFGSGINSPSLTSVISKSVTADEQGGTMGLTLSLGSLARVVGPLWGGFTFGVIGYTAPYWTAAIFMTCAAIIATVLLIRQKNT